MHTPDRLLRADADELECDAPDLTPRELEQYTRILTLSEGIMARRGIHTMTLTGLALALRMGSATLRKHFCDLDSLLAALIRRHLGRLNHAIGKIPHEAPDRPQKIRAAYLTCTRTDRGRYTDAHTLLVRDRHLLPEDLLADIEATRRDLGETLAHGHAEAALTLLDTPSLAAPCIEAALAAIIATTAKQPKPTPPAQKQIAPIQRARPLPTPPPWAPRDPLGLLRFGPLPILPNLPPVTARPQIHSSA